jgi:hypothetical protein
VWRVWGNYYDRTVAEIKSIISFSEKSGISKESLDCTEFSAVLRSIAFLLPRPNLKVSDRPIPF